MHHWRVFHPELPAREGARIELAPAEAHHAWRVLRRRAGDPIRVFDGRGAEWEGRVDRADRDGVVVVLERALTDVVEAPLDVALYQGLCRPERMDWVIQKATELGLTAIHPLHSLRAEGPPPSASRLARWERIAVEACKQSGRRRLPGVHPVEALPAVAAGELGLLLDAGADGPPVGAWLGGEPPRRVLLAVGPESGFDPGEVARWTGSGWRRAGLGPRVLRTETAGLVAAAILLHRWGDLGRRAPDLT